MKDKAQRIEQVIAATLMLAILVATPVTAYGRDGKGRFKEGMKYAANKQWDKAAEQFALAIAEEASNAEYQLQYQRALVNAAIMLVERGDMLAAQKDYNSAYNAYRHAFAFDPTNELALIKMRRMLEAQGLPISLIPGGEAAGKPKNNGPSVKTSFARSTETRASSAPPRRTTDVILRSSNLLAAIEQLAQTMRLNVAFDQQVETSLKGKTITVELRDVTAPEALETILQMYNLTYAQVGRRTIIITSDMQQQNRMRYERMAVRAFFIKNADNNDLRTAITSTIGTKQVVASKQHNALVVRDSPANLELIESVINSLDKSKAEVLIDINIYEVGRSNLLQLGNQFRATGDEKNALSLSRLGGVNQQGNVVGNAARALKGPLGFAIGLPSSAISFLQERGKAKLLASTQVHVLDNEKHEIRMGQRVPVKTGLSPVLNLFPQANAGNNSGNNPSTGLGTIDNIQYQDVGLNIDVQPQVFEDEVQIKMRIESSSIERSTGDPLTPSFNQRSMSSVARIKDGQTAMIAGISRAEESRQVKGIPLIGLIPILGRFFSTPSMSSQQSDVVITVTPHILRRADLREDDHLAIDAGRGLDPSRVLTIQQILYLADIEEAKQSQVATNGVPKGSTNPAGDQSTQPAQQENKAVVTNYSSPQPAAPPEQEAPAPGVVVFAPPTTPAVVTPKVERKAVARPGVQPAVFDNDDDDDDDAMGTGQQGQTDPVTVSVRNASSVATKGQDLYVAIIVNGNAEISYSNLSLAYDPNILEVKAVRDGGLMRNAELQFHAEGGLLTVQMERPAEAGGVPARGQLLLLVFTVKNQGTSPLTLNEQQTFFRSPNGQPVQVRLQSSQVEVR